MIKTRPRYDAVIEAANKKFPCPCYGCEDRYPACAGHCDRYKEWRFKMSEARIEFYKKDRGARMAESVTIETIIRERERYRKKRGKRRKR